MTRTILMTAALAAFGTDAYACGGFFCDNQTPVDQSGERILFLVDRANEEIEVHVQITYEGPAEDFGWILPVPTEPTVRPSVDDIFINLGNATDPTFSTTIEEVGKCVNPVRLAFPTSAEGDVANDSADGITVASQAPVGPYDSTILMAETQDALTQWLADNNYDLPEAALSRLEPYIASGSWFVALKLAKDRDDGDLVPVALRYPGTEPVIPLQLTGVAATPDMRLQPFILSPARAVPDNYLHVEVNMLAIDWLQRGANYLDVVTRAADEAGGQAFATDFSGPVADLGVTLWSAGMYNPGAIAQVTDAIDLDQALRDANIPITTGTMPLLSRFIEKPSDDITDGNFFSCISCWFGRGERTVDGAALAEVLDAEWVEVMRHGQSLLDDAEILTRLSSSMSADEMTLDPQFVLNPDMGDVSNQHNATIMMDCNGRHSFSKAPRRLVLEDGRELALPSIEEMSSTWDEWTGDVSTIAAQRIESTGASGPPEIVTDKTAEIDAALEDLNAAVGGCGCNSGGPGGFALLPLLGLVGMRRRRA